MTMQLVRRDTLEGLAIPFGSPSRKDLQGEFFTPSTDFHYEWFPTDGRPTLYHHGLDDEVAGETIGRQVSHEVRDDGVWVEVQLAKRSKWVELIRRLLDRDGLGFSSGALPSLVKTAKSGEILSWPWVELSTTPTPASTDARIMASKYLADADALSGYAAAMDARAQFERLEAIIRRTASDEARKAAEVGRRLASFPIDPDTGLPIIDARPTDEARIKSIAADAAKRYAETGDYGAAVAEVLAGVERTRT